jgi:hypothetical protein
MEIKIVLIYSRLLHLKLTEESFQLFWAFPEFWFLDICTTIVGGQSFICGGKFQSLNAF